MSWRSHVHAAFNLPIAPVAADPPAVKPSRPAAAAGSASAPARIDAPGAPPPPPPASPAAVTSQGAFLTVQSLTSYAGGTLVVSLFSKIVEMLWPGTKGSLIPVAIISLVVGLIIYLIAITDPGASKTPRDRLVGLLLAVINSAVLFTSSTGFVTVTSGAG